MKIDTENIVLFLWVYINLIYAGITKLYDNLKLKKPLGKRWILGHLVHHMQTCSHINDTQLPILLL
jgi:hypothetical protein